MDVGLDPRIAERADQNRVEIARQHGESVGRHSDAIAQIALRSPVKIGEVDCCAGCLNDLDGLGNHFPADAVSGDDGDALPA